MLALDFRTDHGGGCDDDPRRAGQQDFVIGLQLGIGTRLHILSVAQDALNHGAPADLRFDFASRPPSRSRGHLIRARLELPI